MSDALVRTEQRDGTAIVTLNRPEKLNALSSAMLEQLRNALGAIERDAAARVLLLTGEGRAFCAGADVQEYVTQDFPAFVAYQQRSRELFAFLDRFPKPTIAAVNGYALGGGFELALCCDVIVASAQAQFGLPEGLIGLCPGGGGTQRLVRAIGRYAAADVLLAGRRLTAVEAQALGLVSAVIEPEQLLEAALRKAAEMCRIAPLAQREMKRLLRDGPDSPLEAALSLEQEVLFRLYHSHDAREGIRAFVEKRAPVFRGE